MRPRESVSELRARILAARRVEGECWVWSLGCFEEGYGLITIRLDDGSRKKMGVHRLAAHLWLDLPLDSPLWVLHRCDNPPCFNPDHLFLGTPQDNTADMIAKGRFWVPRGEQSSSANLTAEQVIEIRQRAAAGDRQEEIAAAFGVKRTTVSSICCRRNWAHL